MLDPKIKTFMTLAREGSYTRTAKILSLTQPAVSHQMRQLEEIYQIKLFYPRKKTLILTPEGTVLLQYAKRISAISQHAEQALEDCKSQVRRFTVGITATVAEYVISSVFVHYCNRHPETHIQISTDSIKNIYDKLQTYELDWGIVEGNLPSQHFRAMLLDTDFLCLVVSPQHRFASRQLVYLEELKREKLILRSPSAGTRTLFESYLYAHGEHIKNFNVVIEVDNVNTIKDLVEQDFGISIMANSACREELSSGRLVMVPVQNFSVVRQINLVCREDFDHPEILNEIQQLYLEIPQTPCFGREV